MKKLLYLPVVLLSLNCSMVHAEGASKLPELIKVFEQYKVCLVLLSNGKLVDKFGLPLQFEIDSEFYSSANRSNYYPRLSKKFQAALDEAGLNELSEDEEKYLMQKLRDDSFQVGVKWGAMFTSQGASSWDEPYRKCVEEHNLYN